jgi:hypothetical protein
MTQHADNSEMEIVSLNSIFRLWEIRDRVGKCMSEQCRQGMGLLHIGGIIISRKSIHPRGDDIDKLRLQTRNSQRLLEEGNKTRTGCFLFDVCHN